MQIPDSALCSHASPCISTQTPAPWSPTITRLITHYICNLMCDLVVICKQGIAYGHTLNILSGSRHHEIMGGKKTTTNPSNLNFIPKIPLENSTTLDMQQQTRLQFVRDEMLHLLLAWELHLLIIFPGGNFHIPVWRYRQITLKHAIF